MLRDAPQRDRAAEAARLARAAMLLSMKPNRPVSLPWRQACFFCA